MTGPKIELLAQRDKDDGSEVRAHTLQKLQDLVDKDVQRSDRRDNTDEKEGSRSPKYDTDGFEIPVGKVPLDGQFTVTEVEELVHMGQEEGNLKDGIQVKVKHKTLDFTQLTILEPAEEDGNEHSIVEGK